MESANSPSLDPANPLRLAIAGRLSIDRLSALNGTPNPIQPFPTPSVASPSPNQPKLSEPVRSIVEGWILWEYDVVLSTNLCAANLGAWQAVRANTQTAGRGRFQRTWISDAGGLWLSAVLPIHFDAPVSPALPLVVGMVVCEALRDLGIRQLRLRWPNDVLVGDRKLAGLLIERFNPERAVIGIGINVRNQPEEYQAKLKNQTARLQDFIPHPPLLSDFTAVILRGLRKVASELPPGGLRALLPKINELWGPPRRVELDLDGDVRCGIFAGVGEAGELFLLDDSGSHAAFHAHQVRQLKELD